MGVARTYGSFVARTMRANPDRAAKMIRLGLHAEAFRTGRFPDAPMPRAYRYLNHMAIKEVADALDHPQSFVWTNIFAPVELVRSFGLSCISMEAISSYLSGFWIEDSLIDACESSGFASTLCSYHKTFLGACESGILPGGAGAVATSLACDGNASTFRYLKRRLQTPAAFIDIPHKETPEGIAYVVEQLERLVVDLEAWTGKRYDEDALREALRRENKSKELYLSFLEKRKSHGYPETVVLRLFLIFATHLAIGSEWALRFFEMLEREVDEYPVDEGTRLFWVHIMPYVQPTLAEYLDYSERLSVVADDFNLDYIEPLDEGRPLEALAKKMIGNIYNGDFTRKLDAIATYVERYEAEGAIEFCQWGCKQSCGGVQLLKNRLNEMGIPLLALDGDAIDRRNAADGQTRTRVEAFLELLGTKGQEAKA